MGAADPDEAGGSSSGGGASSTAGGPQHHHRPGHQQQPPPQQQQEEPHHDPADPGQEPQPPQPPPQRRSSSKPRPPPLDKNAAGGSMIRRSSSADLSRHWKELPAASHRKQAWTPRTDGCVHAGLQQGGGGGLAAGAPGGAALAARRSLSRKRSRTMGDQDLWKATAATSPRAGGPGTPTHAHGPGGLSHSDTFRLALETKWREARAARARAQAQAALEQQQAAAGAAVAVAIEAPAGSSGGGEGRHMHRHPSGGGYRHPGPVARFAAVAADMDDALRPPTVAKTDSLAILVDELVPEAAAAAPLEAAEALCLPGTKGHAAMLYAACACAFGAAFGKAVVSAVSSPLMADLGLSKQAYGTLAGLPAISSLVSGPLGGLLVDRWGPDKGCVAFAACVAVAGALAATALPFQSVTCLALSQVVMGVGKGTLTTAQKVFLRLACAPGEASFFFALSFSLTHLGTFLAFIMAPLIEAASPLDYKAGVYTSAGIAFGCLLLTLPLLGRLDHILPFLRHHGDGVDASSSSASSACDEEVKRGDSEGSLGSPAGAAGWEQQAQQIQQQQPEMHHPHPHHRAQDTVSTAAESTASGGSRSSTPGPGSASGSAAEHGFPLLPLSGSSASASSRSASTLGSEEAAAAAPVAAPAAAGEGRRWWACGGGRGEDGGVFGGAFYPADLCTAAFGLLLLSNLMFYAFFAPLEAFAVPALTSMAGFSDRKASLGASILPALSIVLSPPFGAVVDRELGKTGRSSHNRWWVQRLWPPGSTQLWAMLLPALGIAAIIVHPSLWALGFGLISLGYALSCASLWIVIPEFVATRSLGLSFGLIHAVDDAGILAVQVAIGRMLDQGRTYRGSILPLLLTFALLGAGATLALMRLLRRKLDDDMTEGLEVEMVGVGRGQAGPAPVVVAVEAN